MPSNNGLVSRYPSVVQIHKRSEVSLDPTLEVPVTWKTMQVRTRLALLGWIVGSGIAYVVAMWWLF